MSFWEIRLTGFVVCVYLSVTLLLASDDQKVDLTQCEVVDTSQSGHVDKNI